MKKMLLCAVMVACLPALPAFGADAPLVDMRAKIIKEAAELKPLIETSKDAVLINNMWDSCVITTTQLDAYFHMIGIFNTIKKEEMTRGAVDFLNKWLEAIKRTNAVNMASLDSIKYEVDGPTASRIQKLKIYYAELNVVIGAELGRLATLDKVAKSGDTTKTGAKAVPRPKGAR